MLVINFIVKVKPEYINCRWAVLLALITYSDNRSRALGTVTLFSFILLATPRLVGTEIARGPFNCSSGFRSCYNGEFRFSLLGQY
jgi:hypothetical protein